MTSTITYNVTLRTGGKTPRRRFSYYAADLPAATDEGQYSEVLEELVDAQWQVFRVSPLWNVTWEAAEKRGQDLETSGATASTNILRMLGEPSKTHSKLNPFKSLNFRSECGETV